MLFDIDNRRLFVESTPETACAYLFVSTLGLFALSIPYICKAPIREVGKEKIVSKKSQFDLYAIFFVLLATAGELINILRAGGFDLIASGKAVYQAKTADIFITLPSTFFLQVAFFFLGLRLYAMYETNVLKIVKNKFFLLIVFLALPLIIIYLSVGFRSPLLGIAIAFIIGFSYYMNISKLKRKVILGVFIGYSFLAILFGIRGHLRLLFSSGDWDRFNEYIIKQKTFLYYFNPANNEFGAPYVNYVKFYNDKDNDLMLGSSYINSFFIPIPTFLFPFEKPLPISYKFRDKYFNSWKKTSRIAGSGFSYVMEAQWNFGWIGPFIVYFFTGCFFWLLEYFRNKNKFMYLFPLFYAIFLPLSQSIHRSSFGFLISNFLLIFIGVAMLALVRKIIFLKFKQ